MCTREFATQLQERGVNDGHIILLNRYVVTIHVHVMVYRSWINTGIFCRG